MPCTSFMYFILTSYSLYTEVMLILILNFVQYLQNVVEKGLNGQNHSSSGAHHSIKMSPPHLNKISHSPHPITIWNNLCCEPNEIKSDLFQMMVSEL